MEQEFKIRTYGRTELALLYSPDINGQSAYRKLKNWFSMNPKLRHFCCQKQRTFTPAQVKEIISILGEP
ncbi:MAG: DUF4248 domain-containing protein [Prevotellaceae bacterium]|nr:DUF4248 domain-containing protein [Candidatus Minthosoma caballi]